jgi:sterol desaturase/sphingolipid hydroxylase (fatty acid hydroxylase superfamily)
VIEAFAYLFNRLSAQFLSVSSTFSLTSLACALLVAILFVVLRRRRKRRRIRVRTIARALFPRRILHSESHSVDVGYFFLATFVFGLILAGAMLSYQVVSNAVIGELVGTLGPTQPTTLPDIVPRIAITIALFLAYELAYWTFHYLCHRVPVLWEFHKIHHEATVLTPLTMFRIHPVDGFLHANVTALFLGVTNGTMNYAFGATTYQYVLGDGNLLFVLGIHAYVQLQHSHVWISFRGVFGRIFMSPAHHQIHHSADPAHFNKNLGSCLAVWDWLFGTLHVPAKEPEKLAFGVADEQDRSNIHSVVHGLIRPFVRVVQLVLPALPGRDSGRLSRPLR